MEAFQRTKRLPRLDKVMKGLQRDTKKRMTPEQMWEVIKLHNVRLGGRDERAG